MVKPIPDGYHTVTPYLIVIGGCDAIEFYKCAFGAIEHECMQDDSGKVHHAKRVMAMIGRLGNASKAVRIITDDVWRSGGDLLHSPSSFNAFVRRHAPKFRPSSGLLYA